MAKSASVYRLAKQQIETYKNFKKEYGAFGNAVKLLMGDRGA